MHAMPASHAQERRRLAKWPVSLPRRCAGRAALLVAAALASMALGLLAGPGCLAPAAAQAAPAAGPTPAARWSLDSDVEALTTAAKAGDAAAQYALGMKLWLGKDIAKDVNAAIVWLSRSAAQQYPLADTALGLMYDDGDGVHEDAGKAAFFFTRSATAGEALAQSRLALLYMHGRGVAQDMTNAAHWFRAAADQGLPDAQNNLGYLYAQGLGVAKDARLAAAWYEKAALGGNEAAKENLANLKAQPARQQPQGQPQGQPRRLELKDIVAALEAQPLDESGRAGEYGKAGTVEIKTDPSVDMRLEEIRVGFTQAAGSSWV
ncbi:MAG: tetratricopeptide repeat protein, partial [Alphaproteobacteria bacterium]